MFYTDEKGMHISRGDSADITTIPKRVLETGESDTVTLDGSACVIFTVKSRYSGSLLIKRILTKKNYSGDVLTFRISPAETDTQPCGYEYSFMYMPDMQDAGTAQTYEQGIFEILPSVSGISDLGEPSTTEQYTRSEIDEMLLDKADAADVYSKTEMDTKLLEKADGNDVYKKDEVYSKSEIDSKIGDIQTVLASIVEVTE